MNYLHPSEIERLSHLSNHPFDEIRADSLTPSDYILLGGAKWGPMPDAPGLRTLRHRPSADALARALATAFLVNEKAGNIRLHVAKSRYAQFNRFQHVEVTFVRWLHRWPAESFEGTLASSGTVLDLVSMLAEGSSHSAQTAITERAMRLMAERGLVSQRVERSRRLIVRWRHREHVLLGPRVWEALKDHPATTAAGFIASSAETRPELTEELMRDIRAILSS